MDKKLLEIEAIYNININLQNKLNTIIKKYKKELSGFNYISEINELIQLKNIFIRYVSINDKLEYGGIYYKVEKINNEFYILLINKYKKIWSIKFNDNYIFYKNIINTNESKRNLFEELLKKYDKTTKS